MPIGIPDIFSHPIFFLLTINPRHFCKDLLIFVVVVVLLPRPDENLWL